LILQGFHFLRAAKGAPRFKGKFDSLRKQAARRPPADAGGSAYASLLDPDEREQFHRRKLAPLDNLSVGARIDPVSVAE
jgi:hypothetical protein